MREWYEASDWGRLAEDSATKLKRGQLSVCTVYVYGVGRYSPCAEICAKLAGSFCQ